MMGGLAHLVARAAGRAKSGLSPRVASRFENTSSDWAAPVEISSETSAPVDPVMPRTDQLPEKQQKPTPQTPEKHTQTPLIPTVHQPLPNSPSEPIKSEPPADPNPVSSNSLPMPPPAPMHRTPPLTPMQPEFAGPGAAPDPLSVSPPQPEFNQNFAPPEPLLELHHAPPPESAIHLAPSPPENVVRMVQDQRSQTLPTAEPAEIVIHIGRLDVVAQSEPAKPAPQRQQRRPQMTQLGDYLKGKGGTT